VLPFVVWSELAMKTGEMMLASAQVIGHRTHRIAKAGATPNARDRREFTLMGREKVEAAHESAFAMGSQIARMNSQLGLKAWQDMMAAGSAMLSLTAQVASRGLAPIHSRATANAKRLRRL
jgi:hypothetical protein